MKKEQLQKELARIEQLERKQIIDKNYPIIKKKYEGKYFKYRNCYSCPAKPSDYWWLYVKVVEIKPSDIYDTRGNGITSEYRGYSFQKDKYGQITIQNERKSYIHGLGKEITEMEFKKAWKNIIATLTEMQKL
jgi:hypothetical protein